MHLLLQHSDFDPQRSPISLHAGVMEELVDVDVDKVEVLATVEVAAVLVAVDRVEVAVMVDVVADVVLGWTSKKLRIAFLWYLILHVLIGASKAMEIGQKSSYDTSMRIAVPSNLLSTIEDAAHNLNITRR